MLLKWEICWIFVVGRNVFISSLETLTDWTSSVMSLFFRVNNISVILVVWDHTARNGAEEGGGWRWQPEWDKWRWTEEGDHWGRESEKMCQMQKGRWQRGWIRERAVGTQSDSAVLPLFILTDAKGVLENVGGKKIDRLVLVGLSHFWKAPLRLSFGSSEGTLLLFSLFSEEDE